MMNCINAYPFRILFFSILVSSFSLLCRGQDSRFHHGINGWGRDGVVFLETGRSVVESAESEGNSSLILAAERTKRIDPFDHFKHYTGGWNISNTHYYASVGLTAAPLFVISGLWFLGFGLFLLIISFSHCCSPRQHYGYARKSNALSLSFLVLFTTATIVGCVVLYTGQGKFHRSTTNTLKYVVERSDTTVQNLNNVSYYLSTAKQLEVDKYFISPDVQRNIDKIQIKINESANFLDQKTNENSDGIQHVLDSVQISLIVIAAVMLFLCLAGFFLSVFNLRLLLYILATIAWILLAGTFILCGVFLLLHNVAGDTCVAMKEWVKNPTAHTALDDILPCVDKTTAQQTLVESKIVTFQLVDVVNQYITNVSNKNYPPEAGPSFSYNQTGPPVPVLCNPYQPNMTNRDCESGELDFSNATQEWEKYICEVSADGICTSQGRLTPKFYDQMSIAVKVSSALYRYGPFLVDLQDCSFVRETFTDITRDHCPGLKLYSQRIFIGLTLVSSAVLLSLIIWLSMLRTKRRQEKDYIRPSADMPSQDSQVLQKGMQK